MIADADAAIEAAKAVGVSVEAVSTAEAKVRRVRARRAETRAALEAALAPPPSQINLTALELAVEDAREAGVDEELASEALAISARLAERRAAASVTLTALSSVPMAQLDLPALEAAIAEARSAGADAAPIDAAAAILKGAGSDRLGAAVALQAAARRRAAAVRYRAVRAATVRLQSSFRRLRIGEITSEILMASRMLRAGNIFMKFSMTGPPHDRWVWLSEDVRSMQWADPEKRKKGILKGADATLYLQVGCSRTSGPTPDPRRTPNPGPVAP